MLSERPSYWFLQHQPIITRKTIKRNRMYYEQKEEFNKNTKIMSKIGEYWHNVNMILQNINI